MDPKAILDSLNSPIQKAMEDKGITLGSLCEKLREELDACEVKTFNAQGVIIHSDPLIAWDVRQKARMDAHKLRGDYAPEKKEINAIMGIADLSDEDRARLAILKEEMLK